MTLGESMRCVRKQKGMSQKDCAAACGLSANALCSIENGKSFPTQKTIVRFCEVLGICEAFLMVSCITEDDLPEGKEMLYRLMIEPLKRELSEA